MKKTNRTTGTKQKQGAPLAEFRKLLYDRMIEARCSLAVYERLNDEHMEKVYVRFDTVLTELLERFDSTVKEAARGANAEPCSKAEKGEINE